MLNEGKIHAPGGMEWDETRFYPATKNDTQFKTYELFISGIFCLIFSDHGLLLVTEITERRTGDKGEPLCHFYDRSLEAVMSQVSSVPSVSKRINPCHFLTETLGGYIFSLPFCKVSSSVSLYINHLRNLLNMQILGPHSKSLKSEYLPWDRESEF